MRSCFISFLAATAPGNGGRVHKRHRSTTLAESEAKNVAGVDRRTVAPAPDTQEVPMQFIPVQRVHLVSAHATVGHHHAVSAQHKTLPQAHVVVPVQSVPVQNVPVRKSVPLIDDEDYGYVPPAFF